MAEDYQNLNFWNWYYNGKFIYWHWHIHSKKSPLFCFPCIQSELWYTKWNILNTKEMFQVLHYLPSLLKLISIESVMPSNHLILCCPRLLLPSIFHSIRVIFKGSVSSQQMTKDLEPQLQLQNFQCMFRVDVLKEWLVWSPCSPRGSRDFSSVPQFKNMNSSALSFLYGPNHIHT